MGKYGNKELTEQENTELETSSACSTKNCQPNLHVKQIAPCMHITQHLLTLFAVFSSESIFCTKLKG